MEVVVAKSAGFCFGVKRAVQTVYDEVEKANGKIYTYGPIIHNEQVVEDLVKRGVEVIGDKSELENIKEGTVIIRSHGVSCDIHRLLLENNINLIAVSYTHLTLPTTTRV